jgi:hypothetical protein
MPTLEIMEATMSGIVSAKFPSVTAVALSLVALVLLLALIRAAFTRLVTIFDVTKRNANADVDEKGTRTSPSPDSNEAHNTRSTRYGAMSSWSWSWRWEGLPVSLPVSLAISEKDSPGVGVGIGVAAAMQQRQQERQAQPPKMTWQKHRRSPALEPPCKQPWIAYR